MLGLLVFFASSAWGRGFAYEDLVQLIQSRGLTTIEDVLPLLPESFRSNYTLLHDSRSLQGASFDNPRAILFGEDASLTCAFNGDSGQRGFDSLECFQFRENERKFDFRQIVFPTSANGEHTVKFSAENRSVDGAISCTVCHGGADPRPNWDGYSRWPGAYGEGDDELDIDATHYASFVAKRPAHPRYRWLVQGPNPNEPYDLMAGIRHRPNLRFSDLCGRMNALRAARILESAVQDWQSLAFAAGSLGCELSQAQVDQLKQAGLDHYAADANLDAIFGQLGVSQGDWTTQIFDDPETNPTPSYDHQAGFSYHARSVGMAILAERAKAGNSVLQSGIDRILAYYPATYGGSSQDLLEFLQILNSWVPDPDSFSSAYKINVGYVCPEATDLWVQAYLKTKSRSVN